MRRRCAWCGRSMGVKFPLEDDSFTHGICPDCAHAVLEEAGESCPRDVLPPAAAPERRVVTTREAPEVAESVLSS